MTSTGRLHLPLLATAQAQKEMTHNEALAVLDTAVQAVVVSVGPASVPAAPADGQCWIVGPGATGAWAGQDGALAAWTAGGWRFLVPFEGMQLWSLADSTAVRRGASGWEIGETRARKLMIGGVQVVGERRPAIAYPAGGATIDTEARSTIDAILVTLRTHGLISI